MFGLLLRILSSNVLSSTGNHAIDFGGALVVLASGVNSRIVRGNNDDLKFSLTASTTGDRCGGVHGLIGRRVGRCFHPRLLGHLSRVVIFHRLDHRRIGRVTSLVLSRIGGHLTSHRVRMALSSTFQSGLTLSNCSRHCNTHPVHHTVTHLIRSALTRTVLTKALRRNSGILLSISRSNGPIIVPTRRTTLINTDRWSDHPDPCTPEVLSSQDGRL